MEHYSPTIQPGSSLNFAVSSNSLASQPMQDRVDIDQQMLNLAPHPTTNRYMNQRDKVLMFQLDQYHMMKATARSKGIAKTIQEAVKIVHNVLRELEIQEPRFISTFTEVNGHYEGKSRV